MAIPHPTLSRVPVTIPNLADAVRVLVAILCVAALLAAALSTATRDSVADPEPEVAQFGD